MSSKMQTPIAPYPPASVKAQIPPDIWALCIDLWLLMIDNLLTVPDEAFCTTIQEESHIAFLVSFSENAIVVENTFSNNNKDQHLRRQMLLLYHRTFSTLKPVPEKLLDIKLLSNLSSLYARFPIWRTLLEQLWKQESLEQQASFRRAKSDLIQILETSTDTERLEQLLHSALSLVRAVPSYGRFLLAGSDLIDSLSSCHKSLDSVVLKQKIVHLTYRCIISRPVLESSGTLLDLLFSLQDTSLIKQLLQQTHMLNRVKESLLHNERSAKRAKSLLSSFETYASASRFTNRDDKKRKRRKGKGVADQSIGGTPGSRVHVHNIHLVSQIQELFPHLDFDFVVRLLDEYGDNVESATAHILENDLPPNLQIPDSTADAPVNHPTLDNDTSTDSNSKPATTTSTQPSQRRNVYDDDEFDRLAVDASRIHLGHKDSDLTADNLLSKDQRPSEVKAAIMSALAAFDADDDERDDTYDVADVGGTIDSTADDEDISRDKGALPNNTEAILFAAFKSNPKVFTRDAQTKRSADRAALRAKTDLTDEAIEGWAVMLERDPGRIRKLESLALLNGSNVGMGIQQDTLPRSSSRHNSESESTNGPEGIQPGSSDPGRGRGGGKIRGRGPMHTTNRGGSKASQPGDAAGPSSEDTRVARQRKDANKGSRANHNRRDQRARKMARGF